MIRSIITGGVAALAIAGAGAGIASAGTAGAAAPAPTAAPATSPPARPNCLKLGIMANFTRHQAPGQPTESLNAWASEHHTTGMAVCQYTNASKQITAFNRERFNQYFNSSTGDTGVPGTTVMPSRLVFYTR
jgi:hypothetical protein